MEIIKEIEFENRKDFVSLAKYCENGGKLIEGLEVIAERNFRTPLKSAKLKNWNIGSVLLDLTGYGKYSESSVEIEIDNKIEKWPFTMIMIKP